MSDLRVPDDLADGEGRKIERDDGGSVVFVRAGDAIHAYENRCPHFGIPLDVGRGVKTFRNHILCVNHYAAFRFSDGYCVEGPCLGASLTPVPLAP